MTHDAATRVRDGIALGCAAQNRAIRVVVGPFFVIIKHAHDGARRVSNQIGIKPANGPSALEYPVQT